MTKKQFVMNFIFVDMIAAAALCGHACHKYQLTGGWEMVVSGGLAAVSMLVGMILAFMVADDRVREKTVRAEVNYQKQLQHIMLTERVSCAKVSVNMARAMADRVSNTILSKYVDGLDNDGKRKHVLLGVNQIVDDEMKSLTKALFDELKAQDEGKEKS